ncbi:MAG: hypothetical protein U0L98_07460 [Clostridia bacterium]|nr:hypothetical protein [Clostridia bacterium]
MRNEFDSIACETLCILEHCDKSFINRIPAKILNKLKSIESNSSTNIKIYKNKKIEEQDISEDTKNFIALLYYNYVASVEERKDILSIWIKNDNINNEEISTINLFETKKDIVEPKKLEEDVDDNTGIVVYKENIFKKLLQKIKHFFINKK